MSSYRISETTYASRSGALAAARRLVDKGKNYIDASGMVRWWTMKDVIANRKAGRWSIFAVLDDSERAMSPGCQQALADAFSMGQARRAEFEARLAERAGLAGSGFRPF